jgi:NAD(P)-dependent dehydrogenase (short-subunit alcohol dehydrogenase family)
LNTYYSHDERNKNMQVALITGGAARIGAHITRALSKAGYAVVINYHHSKAAAEALAASLPHAAVLQADLMRDDAQDIMTKATKPFGALSLLVNNASLFEKDEFHTLTPEMLHKHHKIHVEMPLLLSQAFAAQAGKGASIVNMIDQRVLRPNPLFFSYALSKASQYHATQMMAQALAPNIRVNAIGPGPTLKNERQEAADFQAQYEATPLERQVPLDDIAAAVLFLAQTTSLTGQMLALDSGQHLAWKTPDVWGIKE